MVNRYVGIEKIGATWVPEKSCFIDVLFAAA